MEVLFAALPQANGRKTRPSSRRNVRGIAVHEICYVRSNQDVFIFKNADKMISDSTTSHTR